MPTTFTITFYNADNQIIAQGEGKKIGYDDILAFRTAFTLTEAEAPINRFYEDIAPFLLREVVVTLTEDEVQAEPLLEEFFGEEIYQRVAVATDFFTPSVVLEYIFQGDNAALPKPVRARWKINDPFAVWWATSPLD